MKDSCTQNTFLFMKLMFSNMKTLPIQGSIFCGSKILLLTAVSVAIWPDWSSAILQWTHQQVFLWSFECGSQFMPRCGLTNPTLSFSMKKLVTSLSGVQKVTRSCKSATMWCETSSMSLCFPVWTALTGSPARMLWFLWNPWTQEFDLIFLDFWTKFEESVCANSGPQEEKQVNQMLNWITIEHWSSQHHRNQNENGVQSAMSKKMQLEHLIFHFHQANCHPSPGTQEVAMTPKVKCPRLDRQPRIPTGSAKSRGAPAQSNSKKSLATNWDKPKTGMNLLIQDPQSSRIVWDPEDLMLPKQDPMLNSCLMCINVPQDNFDPVKFSNETYISFQNLPKFHGHKSSWNFTQT